MQITSVHSEWEGLILSHLSITAKLFDPALCRLMHIKEGRVHSREVLLMRLCFRSVPVSAPSPVTDWLSYCVYRFCVTSLVLSLTSDMDIRYD